MKRSTTTTNLQVTAVTAGLLALGTLTGCAEPTPTAMKGEAQSAIMPDANLILYYDADNIRGTGISDAFAALSDQADDWGEIMQNRELQELQRKFEQKIGLEKEDVSSVVLAMNLNNIDFDAPEPPAFRELDMVAAVSLKKAVSGENLINFIKSVAAEEDQEPEISEHTHNDAVIYTIENADEETAMEPGISGISMTMIADDQVGLIGSKTALEDAVDRAAAGKGAALTPRMQELEQNLSPDTHAYALFTMTPAMKEKAKEAPVNAQEPTAAFQQALTTLEGVSLGMTAGDQADFELVTVFAEQEGAEQMTAFLENTVISTIRMFAGMMANQRPLPVLQSLEADQADNRSYLKLTVSEEDIQTMRELAEEGAMENF